MTLWLLERRGGNPEDGVPFALAVELLHNYLLIHDDIEDGDVVRRDRPTLWVQLGVPTALNVADFMVAEAYLALTRVRCPDATRVSLVELFSTALGTTVEGQALDLLGRADGTLTRARYEEIIRKKTGRYLAFAWVGAVRIAGDGARDDTALWRVGDHLGASFQMRDDLIDLSNGKGRGGEVGCDIREGKPSFMVAYTLENPSVESPERQRLVQILGLPRDQTPKADVQWVIELFQRTGATEACATEARQQARQAVKGFSRLAGIDSRTVAEFREIAEYVAGREV